MEKKVQNKKNENKGKIVIFFVLVILAIIGGVYYYFNNRIGKDNIKNIKMVLKEKYYSIICLNADCSQIAAYSGNKDSKQTIALLNSNGEKVADYEYNNEKDSKSITEPFAVGKDFFILTKKDKVTKEINSYIIGNNKGKEVFDTENGIKLLTNNLVVMDNKKNSTYSILDSKGKTLYNNITYYNLYNNKTIINIEIDGESELLDENGKLIVSGYSVAEEIKNDNETLYLILKDNSNNSYSYFDISSNKIIGDSFQKYVVNNDKSLTISKNINKEIVNYSVDLKGKQKKTGVSKTQAQIVSSLTKTIDSKKYNIYSLAVNDEKQNYIFADNSESNSFGIYNIKEKKYEKLYDYKKDNVTKYTRIDIIEGLDNKVYYQVLCQKSSCNKTIFMIYNLDNNKSLYKIEDSELVIQDYYQYTNDYKVLKYSSSSDNKEKRGKYVLFDKDNKELLLSDAFIYVVGEEKLIGKEYEGPSILYSSKTNSALNSEKNLAEKVVVNGIDYYKYENEDENKTIIINKDAKELLNIDSSIDLIYSDKIIVYIEKDYVYMINNDSDKVKMYKLRENEKLNDASGLLIPPFRGVLFVNNSTNNYIKVINQNGKVIKSISNAEIEKVYSNSENSVIIITKTESDTQNLYGLYIAK